MNELIKAETLNYEFLDNNKERSFYICAAGFEDRVLGVVKHLQGMTFPYSLIFEYTAQKEDNEPNLRTLTEVLRSTSTKVSLVSNADPDNPLATKRNLVENFERMTDAKIERVFIDISGMTNALILQTLSEVKRFFVGRSIYIFYTEAESYYPSRKEEEEIYRIIENEDTEKYGEIFSSSGAKETFILADFQGKFRDYLPICLIFFVGFEPVRSKGLIEQYTPNVTVVCYGKSPHENFQWRTSFSKKIHENVFKNYPHIDSRKITSEDISTFDISDIFSRLEKIYYSFYEDYNISITPQCSKLQAVATYLFTLDYPEVQVVFCLPGYFNQRKYSKGIGPLHVINLFP